MSTLVLAGELGAAGLALVFGVGIAERLGGRTGRAQARRDLAALARLDVELDQAAAHVEDPGTAEQPAVDAVEQLEQLPPVPAPRGSAETAAGRHRVEDALTGSFSATAVLRRLNAEADQLPPIGRRR